jgi:hypothetical protein
VLGLPSYKKSVGFIFISVFSKVLLSLNFVVFVTLNF